jgi:uncharacterized secreted protein with C-terminal beta-propeller domain
MDEYNENLRVSTTTGNWRDTSLNHLYVLDSDLNIIGSIIPSRLKIIACLSI